MTTPVFLTGFEHGVATLTTNGGGLFNTITGSPAIQGTVKNTGSYALKLPVSSSACNVIRNLGTSGVMVGRIYLQTSALPTAGEATFLVRSITAGGLLFANIGTDNKIYFGYYVSTGEYVTSTNTISANTMYYIDFKVVCNATTWTVDWKINGVAQTSGSWGSHSNTTFVTGLQLGTSDVYSQTYDLYIDDVVISHTSADYPIGPGGTEALVPASDGTHNAGTNCMEDNAGTDIGSTSAYNKINSIPPSSTNYIRQAATGTGNYAEVLFGDIAATHNGIIGAMGILAYTSATTTANNGGCIISKDSFSTSTTIWGASGALSDYSDGSTSNLYYKSALLANVNDDTTVNALKARMGYSSDVSPNPYWIDLIVEVGYTIVSGLSATVNQNTETDTAQAISKRKNKAVGQNTESDTAQTITRVKRLAVAQVSETDTPQAISRKKIRTVGQVTETDLAQAVTHRKIKAVGQVTETDTAQAIAHLRGGTVAQVTETDAAQAITHCKIKTVGQVTETDTAQPITARKIKTVAQVSETDSAQAITHRKIKTVAQVTETDIAQLITAQKIKTVAQVTETDTAQSIICNKIMALGQVTESDSAQAITHRKIKAVAQVTETDIAQPISTSLTKIIAVGQIIESDSAPSITAQKIKSVAQVTETDTAQAIAHLRGGTVAQVTETDAAQAITHRKIKTVAQVTETDTAQPITARKIKSVAQVTEADSAQAISIRKVYIVAQVTESDTAQGISARKIHLVLQVAETDTAQGITRAVGILIQQVQETDLAQSIFPLKRVHVVQVVEVDIAQSIGVVKIRAIGQVTETDEAQTISFTTAKIITMGLVVETDLAFPIVAQVRRLHGLHYPQRNQRATLSDHEELEGLSPERKPKTLGNW